jgi:hypothetical protein
VDPDQLDDTADQAVEEAERHRRGACPSVSCLVKTTILLLDPSGVIEPAT